MERTLVVLKPDALQRGIVGDIITRFEKIGLKIVGMKMLQADTALAEGHYPSDRRAFIEGLGNKTLDNYREQGKDPLAEFGTADPHEIGLRIQKWLVEYISSGPVLAMVLEGPHAVELIRKLVGHTLPAKAQPGTIRGDYSFDSSLLANEGKRPIRNLIHASGDTTEAEMEITAWFTPHELFTYKTIHQQQMLS